MSASAFGLPEYGAAVSAGVIPADNPQVVNFLAVANFNGDGRDDVMVVRALYQSNRTFPVVVLANQGNGRFVDQTASIFDGAPPQTMDARRVVVADFSSQTVSTHSRTRARARGWRSVAAPGTMES